MGMAHFLVSINKSCGGSSTGTSLVAASRFYLHSKACLGALLVHMRLANHGPCEGLSRYCSTQKAKKESVKIKKALSKNNSGAQVVRDKKIS